MTLRTRFAGDVADATRYWWMLLITGSLWILVSLAILQFDLTSVWSIAILTGCVLLAAGVTEFFVTALAPRWKVAHGLLGVLFIAGGVAAFAWPGATFEVLARLMGWYLLVLGTFEIVEALAFRTDLWWLRLITGIASIAIAFWAVQSLSRSATLLVLWVGIGALMRGITHLFLAFEWRHVHELASGAAGSSATPGQRVDLTSDTPATA